MRHSDILSREKTALVLIDYQEKLLGAMQNPEEIVDFVLPVVKVASDLDIPVIVTEQNPEGLGMTVSAIIENAPRADVIDKMAFSCFGCLDFVEMIERYSPRTLIISGIETHVCIEQTTLDAIQRGFGVHVMADACSSRREVHHEIGLIKIRDAGAVLTTTESVIFELLEKAGTPLFKEALRLIK